MAGRRPNQSVAPNSRAVCISPSCHPCGTPQGASDTAPHPGITPGAMQRRRASGASPLFSSTSPCPAAHPHMCAQPQARTRLVHQLPVVLLGPVAPPLHLKRGVLWQRERDREGRRRDEDGV